MNMTAVSPPEESASVSTRNRIVCFVNDVLVAYAAFVTLPDRRQRVQTRRRLMPPFTTARTRCRFGSNRRGLTLCAWLMFRPTTGPFPQTSQRFAMFRTPLLPQNVNYNTSLEPAV